MELQPTCADLPPIGVDDGESRTFGRESFFEQYKQDFLSEEVMMAISKEHFRLRRDGGALVLARLGGNAVTIKPCRSPRARTPLSSWAMRSR